MKLIQWLLSLFGFAKKQNDAVQAEVINGKTTHNSNEKIDDIESRLTSAGVSEITFHPKLVENLKKDHQHLLGLYTLVLETIDKLEYHKITGQLEVFKADFSAHLQTENIKFYGFLEKRLNQNENQEQFKEMRSFRKDMRSIETAVNKFLNTWIMSGIDSSNVDQFTEEFKGIGAALVKRIESEETTLYPIYEKAS